MTELIIKIMEAKTTTEIDDILLLHWNLFVANPDLLFLARNSKRRIRRLNMIKNIMWKDSLN